jgi:hypothetical protein
LAALPSSPPAPGRMTDKTTRAVPLGSRASGPQVPRAVQRSIHDAHGEDCTDAAEGDAMPTIRDVMNAV